MLRKGQTLHTVDKPLSAKDDIKITAEETQSMTYRPDIDVSSDHDSLKMRNAHTT